MFVQRFFRMYAFHYRYLLPLHALFLPPHPPLVRQRFLPPIHQVTTHSSPAPHDEQPGEHPMFDRIEDGNHGEADRLNGDLCTIPSVCVGVSRMTSSPSHCARLREIERRSSSRSVPYGTCVHFRCPRRATAQRACRWIMQGRDAYSRVW
jgi:hypothetical protein